MTPDGGAGATRGHEHGSPTREVTAGTRSLLWIAGGLVFLAGIQLFVFTERTETYFAWTIDVPLTAAFLGAGYWASVAFEWLAARERVWAYGRIAIPSVFLFTTLTLVATLLHLDLFHLGGAFGAGTQDVTWAWLAIYTIVPVVMAVLFVRQISAPGRDPPKRRPLPRALAVILGVQATLMIAAGAYLFVAPERAASLWPWPLTPLTGRAVGAWVVSIGVAAAQTAWENDLPRVRIAAVSYLALSILQFIALARYPSIVQWGAEATVYVIVLASMLLVGAGVILSGSRPAAA